MSPITAQRQQGVVLIIGLVLLMALTIVGVASMSNNTLEQRMAGNAMDSNLAFNAAETAARAFEATIDPNDFPIEKPTCTGMTFDTATTQPCVLKSSVAHADPDWMLGNDHVWWTTSGGGGANFVNEYKGTYTKKIANYPIIKTAPRVIAEKQMTVRSSQGLTQRDLQSGFVNYYRLTARGTGASDNSLAVTQHMVARYK